MALKTSGSNASNVFTSTLGFVSASSVSICSLKVGSDKLYISELEENRKEGRSWLVSNGNPGNSIEREEEESLSLQFFVITSL